MSRTISIAILVGSALLAACHGSANPSPPSAPGDGAPGGGTATAPSAVLNVANASGATGPFAVANLETLAISVDGAHLSPGSHAVRLDVTSPGGTLYAQFPATLVAGQDGQGRATATLQVRGSVIESFQQVGSWRFVADVDGVPLAAASVELTE